MEEEARKLFTFRTRWGLFRYTRMVMGNSRASSECHMMMAPSLVLTRVKLLNQQRLQRLTLLFCPYSQWLLVGL